MDGSTSSAPAFGLLLYSASAIALTVLSFLGVPWTSQSLGGLIFLSAFPLLWLNERRAARMVQLLQKAQQKIRQADADEVNPYLEGELVLLNGPLLATEREQLLLKSWGVQAPPCSAGLRVCVEQFIPLARCSWRPLLCQRGKWSEGIHKVPSADVRAADVRIGCYSLSNAHLERVDGWRSLNPPRTERFIEVIEGIQPSTLTSVAHGFGFANPLPFPGERPLLDEESPSCFSSCIEADSAEESRAVLYYPHGGGNPQRPMLGDLRVSFFYLPGDSKNFFTAVGVQRGGGLQPFCYRAPPPQGISIGRSLSADFNLGFEGHQVVPTVSTDDDDYLKNTGKVGLTSSRDVDVAMDAGIRKAMEEQTVSPGYPAAMGTLIRVMTGAAEGWRQVLHRTVPETLLFVVAGSYGRCSFFLRAQREDLWLTWRLRCLGFMVMSAGLEIFFWKWYADMAIVGGLALSQALWVVVLVPAGGFTAITVAAASLFYRPVSAAFFLFSGVMLFGALFGWLPLLTALGFVSLCMACVAALMMLHLAIPC
jgi:hypothetical protein